MSLQQGSVTDARPSYRGMELVDVSDYRKFVSAHDRVVIGNVIVKIGKPWSIKECSPPQDYKPGIPLSGVFLPVEIGQPIPVTIGGTGVPTFPAT